MTEASLLTLLDRLLARPALREVRVNAARPAPPPRRSRVHPFAEVRVIVVLEGRKEEVFGDGTHLRHWAMQPGDALVVRPETWLMPLYHTSHRHFGAIVGPDRVRATWTRCDGDARARQPLAIEAAFEVPMPAHGALHRAVDALAALDAGAELDAARPLVGAFLRLLRASAARPAVPLRKGERTWRDAHAWLQDHCHLPVTRDEAAAALGVSPNYLSRLCRARGGRSFLALLTGMRLEKAAALLRGVDLPVAAIARACGFADAGYFIRRFGRAYEATPGAYRRAHRTS